MSGAEVVQREWLMNSAGVWRSRGVGEALREREGFQRPTLSPSGRREGRTFQEGGTGAQGSAARWSRGIPNGVPLPRRACLWAAEGQDVSRGQRPRLRGVEQPSAGHGPSLTSARTSVARHHRTFGSLNDRPYLQHERQQAASHRFLK